VNWSRAPQIVRIADVAVFREHPNKDIPDVPPLLIVEVITPEDRFTHIMQKLDEYRRWGVEHVWLVVPDLRRLYVYNLRGLMEVGRFELEKPAVRITADELFAKPTVQ
jgi:Uma2 family endonuclease